MTMQATVLGTEQLAARFDKMGPTFKTEMAISMNRAMITLQQVVKFQKLSGDPLKNRTGTLRRSVNMKVKETADTVVGSVGTNVWYGKVHEFGGTFTISAQVRTITQAWGKALAEPKTVNVRAHKATYPKRAFLAPAFEEQKTAIFEELQAGATRALGKV